MNAEYETIVKEHENKIRKLIKDRRQELDYSQEKLAELSGLERKTIYNVESTSSGLTIATIIPLFLALEISMDNLYTFLYDDKSDDAVFIHTTERRIVDLYTKASSDELAFLAKDADARAQQLHALLRTRQEKEHKESN